MQGERTTAVHVLKPGENKISQQRCFFYLPEGARRHNLSRSNVLAENRKFFPLTSPLAPSLMVTPFGLMKNQAASGEDLVILACTVSDWSTRTDGQRESRWLRRATAVAAVARKNEYSHSATCQFFCLFVLLLTYISNASSSNNIALTTNKKPITTMQLNST